MKVQEVMTAKPEYLQADATIREAAIRMMEHDRGFEPIGDDNKLVGVITDRDLALRGMADGKTPDDAVSSVMSGTLLYCFQDQDINDVLENMKQQAVQRLVVLNNEKDKEFVGIVAISDIADHCKDPALAQRIVDCCRVYH
ncbi:CBS domain-containing protein [Spongiibacter sp. IMCC21906]|uniref:CBS domain-containing protein n=1 Tax=Spongiibacter sp. IMCC21906 TaxID=1620392 RepID=UPI00062DE582|nr:CBS domain-containing protein [Spongiibacter sp. IMCC21906]AKH69256.1 CBS domain-containing protein [Spongiibacter sp. IMCC21906]